MKQFGIGEFIKDLDLFSKPLPTFNINGKTSVPTWAGTISTLVILMITFAFGLLKLQNLVERKNPTLSTNTEPLEADVTYSLDSEEF